MRGIANPCSLPSSCRIQHILNENAIAGIRTVHKFVGDGTHQFAVLNDR